MQRWLLAAIFLSVFTASSASTVHGVSSSLVISQIQTAGIGTGNASQEFVELQNTSSVPIEVTGWCVLYSSSSNITQNKLGCLKSSDADTQLWLESQGRILLVSPTFPVPEAITPDGVFDYKNGMAATAGHVTLIDSKNSEIDRVAWGLSAVRPEAKSAPVPPPGSSIMRIQTAAGGAFDSDDNSTDFVVTIPVLTSGTALYEIVIIPEVVDACTNIDDIQTELMVGYEYDSDGLCQPDICWNYDGLQSILPKDTVVKENQCSDAPLESATIFITELLPNAKGADTGKEFIELFNPGSESVDISGYSIWIGNLFDKQYEIKGPLIIPPYSYITLSDTDLGFTLVNTTSSARLVAAAGNTVSETVAYIDPKDDISWSLIDNLWQFTNQPTPGEPNKAMVYEEEASAQPVSVVSNLGSCPEGKYRNTITNRCRTNEATVGSLTPCDEDEYRNIETNRCRRAVLSSTSLTPCKEDQERNPETNRCRKVGTLAQSSLTPCQPGSERNIETNRCRKVVENIAATALVDGEQPKVTSPSYLLTGGIAVMAVGYGLYEWRHELSKWLTRWMPGKRA